MTTTAAATGAFLPPRKRREKRPMQLCPECGYILRDKDRERSTPQLKRFFKVIRMAHTNWSVKHEFQPKNYDHFRYWLEHKCGHSDVVKTVRCESVDSKALTSLLTAVLQTSDDIKMFVELAGSRVIVSRTKSINYDEMDHWAACQLFADVEDLIEAETGFRMPPKGDE